MSDLQQLKLDEAWLGQPLIANVLITVTGKGEFPFDQLRRYRLIPAGTNSANRLDSTVAEGQRDVELDFADSVTAREVYQCILRFNSFGWSLSDITVTAGGDVESLTESSTDGTVHVGDYFVDYADHRIEVVSIAKSQDGFRHETVHLRNGGVVSVAECKGRILLPSEVNG
jgi:hypothetical protein